MVVTVDWHLIIKQVWDVQRTGQSDHTWSSIPLPEDIWDSDWTQISVWAASYCQRRSCSSAVSFLYHYFLEILRAGGVFFRGISAGFLLVFLLSSFALQLSLSGWEKLVLLKMFSDSALILVLYFIEGSVCSLRRLWRELLSRSSEFVLLDDGLRNLISRLTLPSCKFRR